jgi:hypothetical protein
LLFAKILHHVDKEGYAHHPAETTTFFLFGKYPDFEDADTLRQKAWKSG